MNIYYLQKPVDFEIPVFFLKKRKTMNNIRQHFSIIGIQNYS